MGRLFYLRDDHLYHCLNDSATAPMWVNERCAWLIQLLTSSTPEFPCFFGEQSLIRGSLWFTFLHDNEIEFGSAILGEALLSFLESCKNRAPYPALIAWVGNDITANLPPAEQEMLFWSILQQLHDYDPLPWPDDVPTDPDNKMWDFCYGGHRIFITGHAPYYQRRLTRKSAGGMMIVIQPSEQLDSITNDSPKAESIRRHIRAAIDKYDQIAVSPDLGAHGLGKSWKMFWLSDNNATSQKGCPLRIESKTAKRHRLKQEWRTAQAQFCEANEKDASESELYISGEQVMQSWETPIMTKMAEVVARPGCSILEIGFGLGISASNLIRQGCTSYTVIEAHPDVATKARVWATGASCSGADIQVIEGFWQDVVRSLNAEYDGILFDTYELCKDDEDRYSFEFFPYAAQLLSADGRFTYYSDFDSRSVTGEHVRRLLTFFDEVSLHRVENLVPFENTNYWKSTEMLVPLARKPRKT